MWDRDDNPGWFFVRELTGVEINPQTMSPMELMAHGGSNSGPFMEYEEKEYCSSECVINALIIKRVTT